MTNAPTAEESTAGESSTGESSGEQRHGGLWRHSDFMKFWSADTISLLGSQISLIAIPLLAVTTLKASSFEMGVLNTAQLLPYLVLTLFAGVWVDRRRRLPLVIATNFGRAVLVGFVPVGIVLHLMNVGLLSALVFLAGMLTVVFELAYQAYIPSLVGGEYLIDANGKLQGSQSFAQLSGPGTAGLLVGTIGAPVAIAIDAVSYFVGGVTLLFVRAQEPAPVPEPGPEVSIWVQIGRGLRLAVSNVYLRALGIEASIYNLFNSMIWTVLILYLARSLHFSPLVIGLILTTEGVGALIGSFISAKISRRFGLGHTLIGSIVIANCAPLLIPLTVRGWVLSIPLVTAALLINGIGLVVYGIQSTSVRQTAVSSELLGRTNAGYRFAVSGSAAIGAFVGGVLGGVIGLRATMIIGALGTLVAMMFVINSPIPKLRSLSELQPDNGQSDSNAGDAEAADVPQDVMRSTVV